MSPVCCRMSIRFVPPSSLSSNCEQWLTWLIGICRITLGNLDIHHAVTLSLTLLSSLSFPFRSLGLLFNILHSVSLVSHVFLPHKGAGGVVNKPLSCHKSP